MALLAALLVAFGADALDPRPLLLLDRRVHLEDVAGWRIAGRKIVDADDDAPLGFDFALVDERGVLNFALHVAALDRRHRAAQVVDLAEVLERLFSISLVRLST